MCAQTIGQSRQEKVGARQQRGRRDTRGALADEKALRRRGERDLRSDLSAPLAIADCAPLRSRGFAPCSLLQTAALCRDAPHVTHLCRGLACNPALRCSKLSAPASTLLADLDAPAPYSPEMALRPSFSRSPDFLFLHPVKRNQSDTVRQPRLLPLLVTACQVRTRVLPTRPTLDIVCRLRWVRTCSL